MKRAMKKTNKYNHVRGSEGTVGQKVSHMVDTESLLASRTKEDYLKEIMEDQTKTYIEMLHETVEHALNPRDCKLARLEVPMPTHVTCLEDDPYITDFYITSLLRFDLKLPNVLINKFFATKMCPTPQLDQTVFKYNYTTGDLEYMWTVPDEPTLYSYKMNPNVPPERVQSYLLAKMYESGELLLWAKKLNGEALIIT